MASKKLTEQEKAFCRHYVLLRSPREAAVQAGYPEHQAQETALELLDRRAVQRFLRQVLRRENPAGEVEAGYRRLAFGPVGDAVRVALLEEGEGLARPEALDLYCVTEIKRVRGGCEIKLADRLQALDRLRQLEEEKKQAGPDSFYQALLGAAEKNGDNL